MMRRRCKKILGAHRDAHRRGRPKGEGTKEAEEEGHNSPSADRRAPERPGAGPELPEPGITSTFSVHHGKNMVL